MQPWQQHTMRWCFFVFLSNGILGWALLQASGPQLTGIVLLVLNAALLFREMELLIDRVNAPD